MTVRSTLGILASLSVLQFGGAVAAQDKAPGLVVHQNSADAETEVDPNDPRPVILQNHGALLYILMNLGPAAGDTFRPELDAYNSLYPVPATSDLAAAILARESAEAEESGSCVAKMPTRVKAVTSTAAPAVRQYIAEGRITNAWLASHKPKGCGKLPTRVYTIVQEPDGSLSTIRMGSGETHINLNIHYDLSRLFVENLPRFYEIKKADCSKGDASYPTMRVVSVSDDWGDAFYGTRLSGKWREEWSFTGCGGTAIIPVDMEWKGATNTEYLVQFPEATFTPDDAE